MNLCMWYSCVRAALSDYYYTTNLLINKALDCIVITVVNLVQVYGVIDVRPHVVIMFDVVVKPLGLALKLMAR